MIYLWREFLYRMPHIMNFWSDSCWCLHELKDTFEKQFFSYNSALATNYFKLIEVGGLFKNNNCFIFLWKKFLQKCENFSKRHFPSNSIVPSPPPPVFERRPQWYFQKKLVKEGEWFFKKISQQNQKGWEKIQKLYGA